MRGPSFRLASAVSLIETSILENLQVFISFARSRLGDVQLAEDVVQESLLKALAAERQPLTEEETPTWMFNVGVTREVVLWSALNGNCRNVPPKRMNACFASVSSDSFP